MSFFEYVTEVTIVIILYVFSEYILMPKIIQPISVRLNHKWNKCLMSIGFKKASSTSLVEVDDIPYISHNDETFKSSFYTLTAMTPISSHLSDEYTKPVIPKSTSFTSSPGLVSKYLDNCEDDRCASATSALVRESQEQLTNSNMMASGTTPFMSSPSMVNRFLDECEADRECDSLYGMASPSNYLGSYCSYLLGASAKRPKPLPRRVVLLRRQCF